MSNKTHSFIQQNACVIPFPDNVCHAASISKIKFICYKSGNRENKSMLKENFFLENGYSDIIKKAFGDVV
jgi:hypothetical protein